METIIYQHIVADPTLQAALGADYLDKINPSVADPNPPPPFVVYELTGAKPEIHLGGVSALSEYTLTVEIVALTYAVARAIADAVIDLLHGWHTTGVQGSFLTGQEFAPEIDPNPYYHGILSFQVWATV